MFISARWLYPLLARFSIIGKENVRKTSVRIIKRVKRAKKAASRGK